MNILALNTDEGLGLYSGKLVYSAEETRALLSCVETAEQVQQLKSSASQQFEKDRLSSQKQGFEQGLQEGREQAKKEIADALIAQQNNLHLVQQGMRNDSVVMALEVVKKIASNIAPEQVVMSLAQTAAKELAPDATITLHTHSSNVSKLTQRFADASQTQFVEVCGDDTLAIDSCVLETQLGLIEADLTTQLTAIEQHLKRE